MGVLEELLRDVPLPGLSVVRQRFPRPRVEDIEGELIKQFRERRAAEGIRPGSRVAITAGSRGIANMPLILRTLVRLLREAGAEPFLFPAMGSHGGADAMGQLEVLSKLGITEETVGAPILSSMETVRIGETADGLPVCVDRYAWEADGIVVVNRVKPHTSFRGVYESGLMKMLAIGLGKQRGAEVCHSDGFSRMAENVPALARVMLEKCPVLFGVGILENAYDETAGLHLLLGEEIESREPELLREAWELMPRIWFDKLDVLVIDEIGKDLSGTGMDTNVVGRYHTDSASGGPDIKKLVVRDLSKKTGGNGNGIGLADFTTRRAYEKFSFEQTYPNSITSTVQISVKLPMILDSDRLAFAAAVKTCNIRDMSRVRLVRIRDTKHLDVIQVSEALLEEASGHPQLEVEGPVRPMVFDEAGRLAAPRWPEE